MMDVVFTLEDRGNKRIVSCVTDLRGVLMRGISDGNADLDMPGMNRIVDAIAERMASESVFICETKR